MSSLAPLALNQQRFPDSDQELYEFLAQHQGAGEGQIVSFSQRIELGDPLDFLDAIAGDYPLYFYWENTQETILSYGIAASLTVNSGERFRQARKFVDICSRQVLYLNALAQSEAKIFCSFSFFEQRESLTAPFPLATLFLPRFQIIKRPQETILTINLPHHTNLKLADFYYHPHLLRAETRVNGARRVSQNTQFFPSYNFPEAVSSALQSIRERQLSKIVLAHALDVVNQDRFSVVRCLRNLRDRHPGCQIFSLGNSQGYHFLGASPERLINIKNRQLLTDALAGSAPRGKNSYEDQQLASKLLGSEKERREHQSVSAFITQRLSQLGLKPQQSPLKLLKLSNIQHLWTPIYAQLPPQLHPLDIVAQLHPTPAVAGVPREIALEQIRYYETFDRCLYAAPLGWVDFQGNSEFIVGIRSALIKDNHARLYAGAGIVAGSDPAKELIEIQLKFQAMLRALL
jgi:menaquinone-specific isochorismate synthase